MSVKFAIYHIASIFAIFSPMPVKAKDFYLYINYYTFCYIPLMFLITVCHFMFLLSFIPYSIFTVSFIYIFYYYYSFSFLFVSSPEGFSIFFVFLLCLCFSLYSFFSLSSFSPDSFLPFLSFFYSILSLSSFPRRVFSLSCFFP